MFIAPQSKIARTFIALTIILVILTIFGLFKGSQRVTILITAKSLDIEGTFTKTLNGQIISVEAIGEETFAPKSLVTMEDYALGEVIIVNDSNQGQVLVANTRILSPDGLIFRLTNRVNVPAQQKLKTTVKADKPGEKYEIGPTTFTIPGLSPLLQKKIYAESKTLMTGGVKRAGIVMQKDIDEARDLLKEKLLKQNLDELKQKFSSPIVDKIVIQPEIVSFVPDVKADEEKDSFTAKMTLKTTAILVREQSLLSQAEEELAKKLPPDQEILKINSKTFTYRIKSYDPEKQNAVFELYLAGQAILSSQSEKLNKNKFFGLTPRAIKNYLSTIEGVDNVKVTFSPFFLKKAPDSEKRIIIKIKAK